MTTLNSRKELPYLLQPFVNPLPSPYQDLAFNDVKTDSKDVQKGDLFIAIQGQQHNGLHFAKEAVNRGAIAVIGDQDWHHASNKVPYIKVKDARQCYASIIAWLYPVKPSNIVAVTGTNGKTSVVHFVQQLWEMMDLKAASIGTLGIKSSSKQQSSGQYLTTPDAKSLHQALSELKSNALDYVAMEASSHGLDQYRLLNIPVIAAAFTNFTQDHLDYHQSMEAYFAAKCRLFSEVLCHNGTAIINRHLTGFKTLEALITKRQLSMITFGNKGADYWIKERVIQDRSQYVSIQHQDKIYSFNTPLIGYFQIENVLAAALLVLRSKPDIQFETLVPLFEKIKPIKGRMQVVQKESKTIIIDYAHTPDGLEQALKALHDYDHASLWVILGCGGDRDPIKRPLMGRIARQYANHVVVTDDNPRTESPHLIRSHILEGCPNAIEIGNRKEAITYAMQEMKAKDILLIAGKGHEEYQIIGKDKNPYSDYQCVLDH